MSRASRGAIPTVALLAVAFTFTAALAAGVALAAEPEALPGGATQDATPSSDATTSPSPLLGRVELRRQNTNRGDPEEATKTTLRFEAFLTGTVTRVRLDLQFPDEKTDFEGDPFQPQFGDIKVRVYFRPFQVGTTRLSSDVEVTFPTADPSSAGSGKYQLSAAIHSVPGAPDFTLASGRHQVRYEWLVRQTVSVAGDTDRKDINTTKPELALRDTIGTRYWLKLTFKPVVDWTQDAKTGADLDLEGGWNASRYWRFSLIVGTRLWGEGVPGTYDSKIELVAGRAF